VGPNYENSSLSCGLYGRDVLRHTSPPGADYHGRFAGMMPAANGWTLGFTDFVQQVISQPGNFAVRLDSITLGSSYNSTDIGTADDRHVPSDRHQRRDDTR
jgi:hypothetical protein